MDRERKERGIDAVSRLANVSKATVSKAMNNCGSMEQGVKNAVLEAARKLQYEPARKERLRRAEAVIGVVMPAKPKYFWGEVIRGVRAADREAGDVGMVLSLFSDLSSERDALYCMDYMEDLRPDMLIVVPPPRWKPAAPCPRCPASGPPAPGCPTPGGSSRRASGPSAYPGRAHVQCRAPAGPPRPPRAPTACHPYNNLRLHRTAPGTPRFQQG